MKILAVDYGDRRIGLAISDPTETMPLALPVYERMENGHDSERLAQIARDHGAEQIVVGFPLNMNGTVGPRAEAVLEFVEELRQCVDVPVTVWDERLSTEEAKGRLRGVKMARDKKRNHLNTVSAQVILESFLENRRRKP